MTTIFRETYGNTIRNRILEYLIENQDIDIAISEMAKELGISKPKAYDMIKEFEDKSYVTRTRIVGKTQLYTLNKENQYVNLFIHDFNECLRLFIESSRKGNRYDISESRPMIVADKKRLISGRK